MNKEELHSLLKENELFEQSTSIMKEYQLEQFEDDNGLLYQGQVAQPVKMDGYNPTVVIFNFKNGYLHSEDDKPAIEAPLHWEYWNNGICEKVVDAGGDTEEYWENGIPIRIETNLLDKNNKDE